MLKEGNYTIKYVFAVTLSTREQRKSDDSFRLDLFWFGIALELVKSSKHGI